MRRVAAPGVVAVLVLWAAGCGGGDSPNPGGSDPSGRSAVDVYCQVETVWDSGHVYWHWAEVKTTVWSDGTFDKVDLGYPIYGGVEGVSDRSRWYTGAPCQRVTLR